MLEVLVNNKSIKKINIKNNKIRHIYHDRYSKFRGNSEMRHPGNIIPDLRQPDKLAVW
jgi:hypothetical protein